MTEEKASPFPLVPLGRSCSRGQPVRTSPQRSLAPLGPKAGYPRGWYGRRGRRSCLSVQGTELPGAGQSYPLRHVPAGPGAPAPSLGSCTIPVQRWNAQPGRVWPPSGRAEAPQRRGAAPPQPARSRGWALGSRPQPQPRPRSPPPPPPPPRCHVPARAGQWAAAPGVCYLHHVGRGWAGGAAAPRRKARSHCTFPRGAVGVGAATTHLGEKGGGEGGGAVRLPHAGSLGREAAAGGAAAWVSLRSAWGRESFQLLLFPPLLPFLLFILSAGPVAP